MARGPSVVIVARHGARLDASDKTWHLTSPTPYDPPLTYGGWTQGKALGLRIAALLHAREVEQAEATKNGNADLAHLDFSSLDCTTDGPNNPAGGLKPPKRKQKIIIHSSPYLRCIQTSTAIAAGLSQFHPPQSPNLKVPEPGRDKNGVLGHSPLSRSSLSKSPSPAVQPALLGPPADPNLEVYPKAQKGGPEKILLRIDAFLGEWLSPDYFEDITPPPNSTMMVAGAKADLLRRGDFIEQQPNENTSKGHFPGGWASKTLAASNGRTQSSDGSLQTIGSLAQALPLRERSSSQGSVFRHRSRSRDKLVSAVHKLPGYIYEPPVPSYAVSGADPIPRGYVSHARDACIQVDFQWDSMRPPQEWGDGGEYGDEWSTMHKRFRKGLAGMMHWYQENGSLPPKDHFPGFTYKEHAQPVQHHASDPLPKPECEHNVDEDEELVLILVTHGAGCNALLGAISNQPVLIDVGLAALSMVVRRDTPRTHSVPSITQRRASVADPGMADTYDMKLLASTDHLRPGVDPAKPQLQPQSPAVVASPSLESRRRFTNQGTNSPIDSPFSLGEPYRSWNSSLGSMRRSSSSGSNSKYMTSVPAGSASPMTGLWSSLRAPTPDTGSEGRISPGHDMVLNFANQKPTPKPTTTTADASKETSTSDGRPTTVNDGTTCPEEKEKHDKVAPLPSNIGRTNSQSARGLWAPKPQATSHGLWGPPKLDEVYEHGRGPKRRWTVTERE